jgi:hypothetical protein
MDIEFVHNISNLKSLKLFHIIKNHTYTSTEM